ncbi:hypothetical protein AB7M63_003015 [Bradyrhizobium japonicum]
MGLRRQPTLSGPHPKFAKHGSPDCGATPRDCLRAASVSDVPKPPRMQPGRLEAFRRANLVRARFGAGIEANTPAPLITACRDTGALADRAHMHVVVIDVSSLLMLIVVAGCHAWLYGTSATSLSWCCGSPRFPPPYRRRFVAQRQSPLGGAAILGRNDGCIRTNGIGKRLCRTIQSLGGCHGQEGVFRSQCRCGACAGARCSVRPTRLSRRVARRRLGRRLAWRRLGRRVARWRLGRTSGGRRYWPRARQRCRLGTWLGVGRTRLGSPWLELRSVWRLHAMASGLDWLGLASRASERMLVRRVID